MNTEIQIFSSPQFGEIRTAGTSEQPLFCLADVCEALELTPKFVNQRLNDEVVSKHPIIDKLGREQNALFVNEDGLYDVILDSRKPQAKAFRKWVTSEVLPSIRKSGGYVMARVDETPEEIMARALQVANDTLKRRDERIQALESETAQQAMVIDHKNETIALQQKEIKQSAPKVEYYDGVMQSADGFTTTQVANMLGMSVNKLNSKLKEIGIQYRQSGQWLLKTPFNGWGLHTTRTSPPFMHRNGTIGTNVYTIWKQKGIRFIVALAQHDWNIKNTINYLKQEA